MANVLALFGLFILLPVVEKNWVINDDMTKPPRLVVVVVLPSTNTTIALTIMQRRMPNKKAVVAFMKSSIVWISQKSNQSKGWIDICTACCAELNLNALL